MNGSPRASLHIFVPLVLVVAVLYLARDFFIPLALAVLYRLPAGSADQEAGAANIGRIASVLTVTVLAFSLIGGVGYIVGGQIVDLATKLPSYRESPREGRSLPGDPGKGRSPRRS